MSLDYFPVEVTLLPQVGGERLSAEKLLRYLRFHLNDLTPAVFTRFEPYNYRAKNRGIERGAYLNIHLGTVAVPGTDDKKWVVEEGAVMVSDLRPDRWIFSTVYSRSHRYQTDSGRHPQAPAQDVSWGSYFHPLNGNREFGFTKEADDKYIFYAKGADRMGARTYLVGAGIKLAQFFGEQRRIEDFAPAPIEQLKLQVSYATASLNWLSFQYNLCKFINDNGGIARVLLPSIRRENWKFVQANIFKPSENWVDAAGKGKYLGQEATPFLHPINHSVIALEKGMNLLVNGDWRVDKPERTFLIPPELDLDFKSEKGMVRNDLDLRNRSENESFWVGFASIDASLAGLFGGHAIVFSGQEDPVGGRTVYRAMGYYPNSGVNGLIGAVGDVPGRVVDDLMNGRMAKSGRMIVARVNGSTLAEVERVMELWSERPGSYRLLEKDCVTFAAHVAGVTGLKVPPRGIPFLPSAFVNDLIGLNLVDPPVAQRHCLRLKKVRMLKGEEDLVVTVDGHRIWRGNLKEGVEIVPPGAKWRMGDSVELNVGNSSLSFRSFQPENFEIRSSVPGERRLLFTKPGLTGSSELEVTVEIGLE